MVKTVLWLLGSLAVVFAAVRVMDNNGAVQFGPQLDVSVYRAGADLLQTDDSFVVKGAARPASCFR